MRFRGRTASDKTTLAPAHDASTIGNERLTLNAEALLGLHQSGRKKTGKRVGQQNDLMHNPGLDQKHIGTTFCAQPEISNTHESLSDSMPPNTYKGPPKLQMWPNVEKYPRPAIATHNSNLSGPRRDNSHQRTNSPAPNGQDYYDSSRQPLYVSQQTSASAARDMSLRKGSPMLHEAASQPSLGSKPLKSALKRAPDSFRRPNELFGTRTSSEKKSRKLDLSHFFHHQAKAPTGQLLSQGQLSRSPSSMTDNSEFFPPETVQIQLKRPAANARFATHKTSRPSAESAGNIARSKVGESDVFKDAKTNVRRPPKGIKNWFDGFEISSDEEEHSSPKGMGKELPAPPTHEVASPNFSPWHLKPDSEQPQFHRKASLDPVEDNVLAIQAAKERMQERMQERVRMAQQRKESFSSVADKSIMSIETLEKKPPSRLAIAALANESVLSLSDSSGDEPVGLPTIRGSVEDPIATAQKGGPVGIANPTAPVRTPQSKRSIQRESRESPRQSTSTVQTNQTSGSIPIRLTTSIPLPDLAALSALQYRETLNNAGEATSQALRRLEGQRDSTSQRSLSRSATKSTTPESESGQTSTSLPVDASHMMAVTEEEMVLLEMMRNKRAAMQNTSFGEGYQLALGHEQERLVRRREVAQRTASMLLQQKDARAKKQRSSRAVESEEESPEESRRKFSALRKADVDRALRLQRLMAAAELPIEDSFPEPPTYGSPTEDKRPVHALELLLPSIYSPTSSKLTDGFSVLSTESSPVLEDDDIEDHHYQVRQFLAAGGAVEGSPKFPSPPTMKSNVDSRRDWRRSAMAPSPVAEEEPIPDDSEVSQHSLSPAQDGERRRSISGRRLSSHLLAVGPYVERVSALPAPLRRAKDTPKAYHLNPNLDFAPLDFSADSTAASPSLSNSRASPLTPSFMSAAPSDRATAEGACSSSENGRSTHSRTYTPETDATSHSAPTSRKRAVKHKVAPKQSRPVSASYNNRHSIASITSASDDVLAAWAELGGGGEALASRKWVR